MDPAARITEWIETSIGGSVAALAQQPRWRPTWFVDVERNGDVVPLCVRGERTDTALTFPLAHEMRFQEVLQRHGIPVPGIHGWIDDLPAVVMDRVPGRPDFADVDPADRDRIVAGYFATLAQVHNLPIEPFVAAGVERAPAPAQSGWYGIGKMIDLFHAQKLGPDPFCEWAVGWIERHPPRSHGRESAVVWDSGQFHHDGAQFVSLIDLEIGHVGDPMMDLAGLRMRDSVIPFGDLSEVYATYEDGGWGAGRHRGDRAAPHRLHDLQRAVVRSHAAWTGAGGGLRHQPAVVQRDQHLRDRGDRRLQRDRAARGGDARTIGNSHVGRVGPSGRRR